MSAPGSPDNPLRVAVIGAGPAGFYACEHILKHEATTAEVDLFDRLPTPYGLVRGGVAPDHPKIKSVTRVYDKTAARDGFRFFGNVKLGEDISVDDLERHYHAILYTFGAETDRTLGHPRRGPARKPRRHRLRRLVQRPPRLRRPRVRPRLRAGGGDRQRQRRHRRRPDAGADRVGAARDRHRRPRDRGDGRQAQIREIVVLGRRGPAQAAFTNPELRELGEMKDADIVVDPEEIELDDSSAAPSWSPTTPTSRRARTSRSSRGSRRSRWRENRRRSCCASCARRSSSRATASWRR